MDRNHVSSPPSDPTEAPTISAPPERLPAERPAATDEAARTVDAYEQCDECDAPVDRDQRYCVVCGAHRRHVNDPAARYLSQATARSRTSRAAATARRTPRSNSRTRGLGIALALALIPAVAALGVIEGRSSNNGDAKLIQALERHQAAAASTATVATAGGTTAAKATTSAKRPSGPKVHHAARASTKRKVARKRAAAKHSATAASNTTQNGSVSQIAGSKASEAQKQQGAQETQKVGKSTGKSYINQQSNLPGTVVVP